MRAFLAFCFLFSASSATICSLKRAECVLWSPFTGGPESNCFTCALLSVANFISDPGCFIPSCDEDGSFSRKQYNPVTDESFCVNSVGNEFAGSRVKGRGADCFKYLGYKPAPPGYRKKSDGNWYKMYSGVDNMKTWNEALDACLEEDAVLAKPFSNSTNEVLKTLLQGESGTAEFTTMMNWPRWIGFTNSITGDWTDCDGEVEIGSTYRDYWRQGLNPKMFTSPNSCAVILTDGTGKWFPVTCDAKKTFICQTQADDPITPTSEMWNCNNKRMMALKRKDAFAPVCNEDGSFQDIQCYKEHCWCVLPSGQVLPDTIHPKDVEEKPNCALVKAIEKCDEDGYAPHPYICSRYIRCGPGATYTCTCPMGAVFDVVKRECIPGEPAKCATKPLPLQ